MATPKVTVNLPDEVIAATATTTTAATFSTYQKNTINPRLPGVASAMRRLVLRGSSQDLARDPLPERCFRYHFHPPWQRQLKFA